MTLARRAESLLPAALLAGLATAAWSLRVSDAQGGVALLVAAGALTAVAFAVVDLERFVLLAVLGAMIFPQALVHPGGAEVAAADLLLVVALGAWLCRASVGAAPRLALTRNPILVPSLLFAGVTACSVVWSVNAGSTLKAAIQTAEIVVVLPLVFASIPTSLGGIRRALGFYVALTTGLALVTAALSAPNELRGVFRPQYLPGLHKNAIGSFLGVGLVVAFAFMLDRQRPRRSRRLYAAAAFVEVLGLLATVSRGAIAGALCGILVVSFALRRSRLRTLAVVLLGGVVIGLAVHAQLNQQLPAGGGFSSGSVRLLSYRDGIQKIGEHPVLGTGAGTYWADLQQLRIGLADPNNLFLLTWAELGLAGMAALLFLLVRYGKLVGRARRLPEPARTTALAAGGSALSLFVHFQVDSTWTRGTASICFALVGVAVAVTRLAQAKPVAAVSTPEDALGEPPLRVLHIVSSAAFAGIERHVVRLARALASRGVAAEIACPVRADRLREEASRGGVPVLDVRRLDEVARRWDVVHVHDGAAAVLGWRLAQRLGSRFVRTQHFVRTASSERSGWRRAASLVLHRSLNADVDALIAVSESAAAAARSRREIAAAKVSVIEPGIELPTDEQVEAALAARRRLRAPVVAFIGRLEREKELQLLLCAVPLVQRRIPNCKFVIAGTGSAQAELRALSRKLRLGRAMRWLGEVDGPEEALAKAHVYVHPCGDEGFGLAVAEAASWALPVVGRRSGGVAEIVEDGETGLLLESADPAELADAIVRLAGDRELAARMGLAGRARAAALGADRTAELTHDLYDRIR